MRFKSIVNSGCSGTLVSSSWTPILLYKRRVLWQHAHTIDNACIYQRKSDSWAETNTGNGHVLGSHTWEVRQQRQVRQGDRLKSQNQNGQSYKLKKLIQGGNHQNRSLENALVCVDLPEVIERMCSESEIRTNMRKGTETTGEVSCKNKTGNPPAIYSTAKG